MAAPPCVTIALRDAGLDAVLDEFRRQVPGVTFELEKNAWTAACRVRELILRDEPWRSALEALADAASAEIDEVSATQLRLVRTPRLCLVASKAPIQTVARLMSCGFVRVDADPAVMGTLSLSMNDVPWKAAVQSIVDALGACHVEFEANAAHILPGGTPAPVPVARGRRHSRERENTTVTFNVREASVAVLVAEFRRQVPCMNFVLDDSGWAADFLVPEFAVAGQPWRRALRAFAEKTGAAVDELSSTLLRVSRPGRVTFGFKTAPVAEVVKLLARLSRINFVMSPDVDGTVTIAIKDMPWPEALDCILKAAGRFMAIHRRDGIVRIVAGELPPPPVIEVAEMVEDLVRENPSQESGKTVEALIAGLGSDEIAERDAAMTKLCAKGACVARIVGEAWKKADGMELKSLLERVIRRLWGEP